MRIDILSAFPDYLGPLGLSLLGKAQERGLLDIYVHDLRTWAADDVHRTLDDAPYGGGPGMVMTAEPWRQGLEYLAPPGEARQPMLVVPTPSGPQFTQAQAVALAAEPWLAFACGRYEGIDARVLEHSSERMRVLELSLGDYVLAGGEAAALVIVEAVARLLPGVLGNSGSHQDDSFSAGLLEGPSYTRPALWQGRAVPPVLLSGDHVAIARSRRDEALRRTAARRPDLLAEVELDADDRRTLQADHPSVAQ